MSSSRGGHKFDVKRFLSAMAPTVEKVEQMFGKKIVVDAKVFEECLHRIQISIAKSAIDGAESPNDFKKAGHYAFWFRKLKPFRIFRSREIIAQVRAIGGVCEHSFDCVSKQLVAEDGTPDRPRDKYVNEFIALMIALAFIRGKDAQRRIQLSAVFIQDLLARLRYDAYTPDNLSILFEAMAEQKR